MLSTLEKVLFLRGVELFGALDDEELGPVARIAQEIVIPAGVRFIVQGDIGDCLYLLVDGEVSVVLHGAGELARRGPGSIIGEMAIITRGPRSADCLARTDLLALKIEYADFWALLDEYPPLARATITVLARRLDEAVANLARLGAAVPSR